MRFLNPLDEHVETTLCLGFLNLFLKIAACNLKVACRYFSEYVGLPQ